MKYFLTCLPLLSVALFCHLACQDSPDGAQLLVIERESGRIVFLSPYDGQIKKSIDTGANLRHASMSFDPALRWAFVTTRTGELLRIDLTRRAVDGRLSVGSNAIGQAIAADGRVVAVSGYEPGQIALVDPILFHITQTFAARTKTGKLSRVTGLVDAPGNRFIASLMDSDEAMVLEKRGDDYHVRMIPLAAAGPFDALINRRGSDYIAAHQDGSTSILDLQTYKVHKLEAPKHDGEPPAKMMHLESWADNGSTLLLPVPGQRKLRLLDSRTFAILRTIELPAHALYVMNRPFSTETYVTLTGKGYDGTVLILDQFSGEEIHRFQAGKKIYHLAFMPRGQRAFFASNETNEIVHWDTTSRTIVQRTPAASPAGIFGIWRAFEGGL